VLLRYNHAKVAWQGGQGQQKKTIGDTDDRQLTSLVNSASSFATLSTDC
jgi:hypothetical protein